MSIALSDFVSNLSKTSVVRSNRFYCYVTKPAILDYAMNGEDLYFFIHGCVLPDRTFGEIEFKYFGMTLKVPGNEVTQDLTITVINEEGWNGKSFFEAWTDLVNDRFNNVKTDMQDIFRGAGLDVMQLDGKGDLITTYAFKNIYPKTVSEIELSYDSTDTHETFQVTFGYSHWIRVDKEE